MCMCAACHKFDVADLHPRKRVVPLFVSRSRLCSAANSLAVERERESASAFLPPGTENKLIQFQSRWILDFSSPLSLPPATLSNSVSTGSFAARRDAKRSLCNWLSPRGTRASPPPSPPAHAKSEMLEINPTLTLTYLPRINLLLSTRLQNIRPSSSELYYVTRRSTFTQPCCISSLSLM